MSDATFIVHLDVRDRGDRLSSFRPRCMVWTSTDTTRTSCAKWRCARSRTCSNGVGTLDVMLNPTDELAQLRVRPVERPC